MIIGLLGYIGSGKDTTAEIIKQMYPEQNFKHRKYSAKLKEICSILLNVPKERFEDIDYKKSFLPEYNMTVRGFMQNLGTDALRNHIHSDIWVKSLFYEYSKEKNAEEEYEYPNWIISDVRFPNEASKIKEMGGVLIKILRKEIQYNHSSEISIDLINPDYIIYNRYGIGYLKDEVSSVLNQILKQ